MHGKVLHPLLVGQSGASAPHPRRALPPHNYLCAQVEGVRCRQHVNPLKKELQVPLPPPDWSSVYDDPARPLVVDVGCGSGRFLLALSQRFRRHNCLGLDIRQKVQRSLLQEGPLVQCPQSGLGAKRGG